MNRNVLNNRIKRLVILFFCIVFVFNLLLQFENNTIKAYEPNLLAYWDFNEGTGTIVYDNSVNGLNSAIIGASWTNGISDHGLRFDGVNDYIQLPSNTGGLFAPFHMMISEYTVAAWFNADDLSSRQIIYEEGGELNGLNLYIYNGKLYGGTYSIDYGYNGEWLSSPVDYGWHHAAIVYSVSNNFIRLYIDGEIVDSTYDGGNIETHDAEASIGGLWEYSYFENGPYINSATACHFDGVIDEVYVYTRALSQNEIQNLYNNFKITNELPFIAILNPGNYDDLSGNVMISGSASDLDGSISKVELKIGSGSWFPITGTTSWSYSWNTNSVSDGSHVIYARSYDGEDYSDIDSINVNVNNPSNINEGLVGYWSFDDSSDVGKDNSGTGNYGINYGATWTSNGYFSGALDFDGTNDYFLVQSDPTLNFNGQSFSWDLWLKREKLTSVNQLVLAQGIESTNRGLHLTFRPYGPFSFCFWANDLDTSLSYEDLNNWHHWVGTYDASSNERKLYYDGYLIDRDIATSDYLGSGDVYIGGGGNGPLYDIRYFNGLIDEVRLYDTVLDSNEIYQHYLGNYDDVVENIKPTLSILNPQNNDEISDTITISGIANDIDGSVMQVELKIDSGSWFTITGTTSWSYSWNTNSLDDGSHVIYARSYDGEDYSNFISINVDVNNPGSGGDDTEETPGFTTTITIAGASIGALVAFFRRRN